MFWDIWCSGACTFEAEACGQAAVDLLDMQVEGAVELPAGFLAFPLQVC